MLAKPKSWSQREGFKSTSLATLGFRNLSYSFFLSGALSEWELKDFHQQPSEMLLQNRMPKGGLNTLQSTGEGSEIEQ